MKRLLCLSSNAVRPPAFLVCLFVVSYGLVTAGLWLVEWPLRGSGQAVFETPQITAIYTAILGGAAALYAIFRLLRFHPICNQAYADWLKSTPWTAARPLPLGPIHPVLQDALVIGVLTGIAVWHAHVDATMPILVFGFFYLAGMTVLLAATRQWRSCLALGFLWPALLLPDASGWPSVVLLGVVVMVIWHGHRRSLKQFPWTFRSLFNRPTGSVLQTEIRLDFNNGDAASLHSGLGWPFMALSPKIRPPGISHRTGLCLSALFGWWFFCVTQRIQADPLPELVMMFAFLAAFFRLTIYLNGTTVPFGFWSRFVRGRMLVPGYDRIFLTPLLTVLAGILGAMIIKRSGHWFPVIEACAFALIWYLLFAGGPTLRKWILTGQHGFCPPSRANSTKQMLRPV